MNAYHFCLIFIGMAYGIESILEYQDSRVFSAKMKGIQAILYCTAGCSA